MARILVVEDSPDNMKLCRAVLTLNGHEVVGLPSGEGLLATLSDATPELVLMDIQLPDKDGFTLLKEIRASPYARLRVIALTAHAMAGDREKALEAGFDGYNFSETANFIELNPAGRPVPKGQAAEAIRAAAEATR
jgi:two-component system cell cycle response regulator DivK